MGAFFGSILVRSENFETVRTTIEQLADETGSQFFIGPPVDGWISVFPENDGEEISADLARRVAADVFHLGVHDDDIFLYFFYRDGKLADQFHSDPDNFHGYLSEETPSIEERQKLRGHPESFQDLLPNPAALSKIKTLLAGDWEQFVYESDRMAQFADLLGLPNAMSGYDHLENAAPDEIEEFDIQGWDKFIHIKPPPDPTGERQKRLEAKRLKDISPEASAQMHLDMGKFKKDNGLPNEALLDFTKAIEFNPHLAEAYNSRGTVKRALGDLNGALADHDKAIELKPNSAAAYSNRGLVKKGLGDFAGALADFDKAIELNPKLAEAYGNRGQVRHLKSHWDGALADFNKALELKPDSATLHNNRGEMHRAKGDLDSALLDYDKALALNPNFASAFNNRGEVKRARRDFDGALADYNRALIIQPNLAPTYNNRAMLKHTRGDLDGALADYNRAIELKPRTAEFYFNRAGLFVAKGDLKAALSDYDQTLALKPDWAEAYNSRGEAKRLNNDPDGALADYTKAIELDPRLASAYYNRCFARNTKGDSEGALADYHKAVELKPDYAKNEASRRFLKQFEKAKTAALDAQKIPATENALALRTDFSDNAAWESLRRAIRNSDNDLGFAANVDFVDDAKFKNVKAEQLAAHLAKDYPYSFAFIIDSLAITHIEHPILVVDLQGESGRTFRVIPSVLWAVENNLSIGNMDFEGFAGAADADGVLRSI